MDDFVQELKLTPIASIINDENWLKTIDAHFSSVEEKLEMVNVAAECPVEYIQLFKELITLLELNIAKSVRGHSVKVHGFGSYETGVALKNCDLDIFIEFEPSFPSSVDALKILRKLFCGRQFKDVFPVTFLIYAKVPILKCEHMLNFQCDISVDNALALHNSQLIKYYLSLNKRYRSLCLLIKLWTKRCVCNSNAGLKSFSVILMVIFYLQQRNLVPSVQNLQANIPQRLVNGWNTAYSLDRNTYQEITMDISLIDLILGFFEYYATFEFGFYIISPYLGRPIRKPLNAEEFESLTDKPIATKWNSFICVQDVFEHNFNTSLSACKQAVISFQTNCALSAQYCKSDNYSLRNVFPIMQPKKKKGKHLNDDRSITLCVQLDNLIGDTEDEWRTAWIQSILSKIKQVLTDVALVTILNEADGQIKCAISHMVYRKKLRCEATQLLEADNKDLLPKNHLERFAVVSAKVATLPGAQLPAPFEFIASYASAKHPTRLTLQFNLPENATICWNNVQTLQEIAALLGQFLFFI